MPSIVPRYRPEGSPTRQASPCRDRERLVATGTPRRDDLPVVERVKRIHDLGLAAEIWSWHGDNKRVGLLVEQLRLLPNRAARSEPGVSLESFRCGRRAERR